MNVRPLQERNLTNPNRRRFSAGFCLGVLSMLAGCGGSSDDILANRLGSAELPAGAPTPGRWDVVPSRALVIQPGASFDLAATLPPTVRAGGVFQVDPSGAALPAGISLSPSGLLHVSSSATGGTAGVVFRYTPPA